MAKRKFDAPEVCPSPYAAMPIKVLDHPAYTGASANAIRLLHDMVRQHNGHNNGRLQASFAWLRSRGWTSASARQKAIAELLERRLIILTRKGGRSYGQIDYNNPPPNQGPDFFALCWLPISNFKGLEITGRDFYPGGWDLGAPPPRPKKYKGRAVPTTAKTGSAHALH